VNLLPIQPARADLNDLARFTREAAARLRMHELQESKTISLKQGVNGTIPEIKPLFQGAAGKLKQFRVHSVQRDTLTCRSYSYDPDTNTETVGTEDVTVAKPLSLQPTYFNGLTIEGISYVQNANGGPYNWRRGTIVSSPSASGAKPSDVTNDYIAGAVIDETIDPPYVPDTTLIVAMKVDGTLRADAEWIEVGPSRAWVMAQRAVSICIENSDGTTSTKRVLIRCSQPFT
jgi:hypothetical protein